MQEREFKIMIDAKLSQYLDESKLKAIINRLDDEMDNILEDMDIDYNSIRVNKVKERNITIYEEC